MWTSITKLNTPQSLKDAFEKSLEEGTAIFSGGTYLASEKAPLIHELILLENLVEDDIKANSGAVSIGAYCRLQQICDVDDGGVLDILAEAARWSCPSKNIRNARTIGGEIARMRINSEMALLLYALNPIITVTTREQNRLSLVEWDGEGIIERIDILRTRLQHAALERFSLLPSAPAFVSLAGVREGDQCAFATGGKAAAYHLDIVSTDKIDDEFCSTYASAAAMQFQDDHFGSLAYKEKLILTALTRIRSRIC